jgi:type IV pilus assembly protein PilM
MNATMLGSKVPIGVDLGSHSVRACQMRRVGDAYELEKQGSAEVDPDGERPSDPDRQRQLKVAALRRALAEGQIKAKQTISAVSGESIIVRYLQLPEMPEDELRKALQWEAEEYIPFRLSEVNLDSMVLGRSQDGDHVKMDVLLVSAKKDLVQHHVDILRDVGLEPVIVDVDSFAFLNCFEANHQPSSGECVALINLGGQTTNLNVYAGGGTRFSRDIMIGGESITTAIRARVGCSTIEAERLKITQGAAPLPQDDLDLEGQGGPSLLSAIRSSMGQAMGAGGGGQSPEEAAREAIMQCLQGLFMEVRRSVEFFENQYRGASIGRVILGGGTAVMPRLAEHFQRELGLPVETIDPLRKVRLGAKIVNFEHLQMTRHLWGVGIGLAMRGLPAA